MNKTPSEILEGAAEILETHGHAKGRLKNTKTSSTYCAGFPINSHCLIGALGASMGLVVNKFSEHTILHRAGSDVTVKILDKIKELHPSVFPWGLYQWNDSIHTTAEDVIDVLMASAKDFRNEGR